MPFYTSGAYNAMLRVYLLIIQDAFDFVLMMNAEYGEAFCPAHQRWESVTW